MPTETAPAIKQRILEAKADVELALREVERVLQDLTADTPRAEKTIITDALRVAFDRLAHARMHLASLVDEQP